MKLCSASCYMMRMYKKIVIDEKDSLSKLNKISIGHNQRRQTRQNSGGWVAEVTKIDAITWFNF